MKHSSYYCTLNKSWFEQDRILQPNLLLLFFNLNKQIKFLNWMKWMFFLYISFNFRNNLTYQFYSKWDVILNINKSIQYCTIINKEYESIGGDKNLQGYKTFTMSKVAFFPSYFLIFRESGIAIPHSDQPFSTICRLQFYSIHNYNKQENV